MSNNPVKAAQEFSELKIHSLSEERIGSLISYMRTIKQTNADYIVLDIMGQSSDSLPDNSIENRINWSRQGQLLTGFIESLPIPTIAIVRDICCSEYAEIALSCTYILCQKNTDSSKYSLGEFPCFGTLKRLNRSRIHANLQRRGGIDEAFIEFWKHKQYGEFSSEDDLQGLLEELTDSIKAQPIVVRRLSSFQNAKLPTARSQYDFLETTIYANLPASSQLDQITYSHTAELDRLLLTSKLEKGIDDLGNDFMEFSFTPDHEEFLLRRKSRLEEVDLLLEQEQAPIRGKCIELGSGYGYFAAKISRSPKVTEAIGLDISAAEMIQLGPYMWEKIQPDWSKLSFRIGDMNKLDQEYGQYDTVIFCASLHHSSDIPKSLKIAQCLLKPGGSLILHGEHYDPVFLKPKKRKASRTPHTITDFSKLLIDAGFEPEVFRYALPANRFEKLKRLLFTVKPFAYVNGWLRFHSFMMLGRKSS